jgi:hypothetical protein
MWPGRGGWVWWGGTRKDDLGFTKYTYMYRAKCNSAIPAGECSRLSGPLHSNTDGMVQSHVSHCVLCDWFRNTGWINRQVGSLLSCDWWHLKLKVCYSVKATPFWCATPTSRMNVSSPFLGSNPLLALLTLRIWVTLFSPYSCYFCYVLFLLVPSFTNVIPVRKKCGSDVHALTTCSRMSARREGVWCDTNTRCQSSEPLEEQQWNSTLNLSSSPGSLFHRVLTINLVHKTAQWREWKF